MTRKEAIAWYDVPSNEMILERARQASKDLRKRFKEDLEQESKTGHWIGRDASGTNFYGKCSCCGQEIQIDAWFTQNMNYCPNCGAKMIEPQESEG